MDKKKREEREEVAVIPPSPKIMVLFLLFHIYLFLPEYHQLASVAFRFGAYWLSLESGIGQGPSTEVVATRINRVVLVIRVRRCRTLSCSSNESIESFTNNLAEWQLFNSLKQI